MLIQQSIGNDLDFFIHIFHFFDLLVVFSLFEVHPSGMLNKYKLSGKVGGNGQIGRCAIALRLRGAWTMNVMLW